MTETLDNESMLRIFAARAATELERSRTEEALKESQRMLLTLMGNLPGMAYRCNNDADWTLEFVSKECKDLTGYDPSDLLAKEGVSYGKDVIHPDDAEKVWEEVQAALRDKKAFKLIYRIIAADGKIKWVWEQGQGVFSPEGALSAPEKSKPCVIVPGPR